MEDHHKSKEDYHRVKEDHHRIQVHVPPALYDSQPSMIIIMCLQLTTINYSQNYASISDLCLFAGPENHHPSHSDDYM